MGRSSSCAARGKGFAGLAFRARVGRRRHASCGRQRSGRTRSSQERALQLTWRSESGSTTRLRDVAAVPGSGILVLWTHTSTTWASISGSLSRDCMRCSASKMLHANSRRCAATSSAAHRIADAVGSCSASAASSAMPRCPLLPGGACPSPSNHSSNRVWRGSSRSSADRGAHASASTRRRHAAGAAPACGKAGAARGRRLG